MTSSQKKHVNSGKSVDFTTFLGLFAVILFFLVTGLVSYRNIQIINYNTERVAHTHEVIIALTDIMSLVKDAETGQRGFVITGDERYLEPYTNSLSKLDERVIDLTNLLSDSPIQLGRIPAIKTHFHAKLDELARTIALRKTDGFAAAEAVVMTDQGKNEMDALRSLVDQTIADEMEIRTNRIAENVSATRIAIISGILTALTGFLLSTLVAILIHRNIRAKRQQEWLQTGQLSLGKAVFGEQRMEKLGENILRFLTEYLGAHAGVFYIRDGADFRRIAAYGVPAESVLERFTEQDRLLGQAVKDNHSFFINDVPDGYLMTGSAFGQSKPKHLVIAPASSDGAVNAVVELGFINSYNDQSLELLNRVLESIAIAIRSATYRQHLQNLLEETQRQAEELQAQSEELRVSNEELEEQGRAVKESQVRLEQQQAELEQTNSQLEEQTQLLEVQRDDLIRAKATVQAKAQELEQASQYKSDFLANMSHELRTPLNSSLILAKLLADNPQGNLSADQVKFARTIQSSGNDLLMLINDILDLSKIEAGHMEVNPGQIIVERVTSDLMQTFDPLAKQKNLGLEVRIAPDTPKLIESDRQRLDQILRNLLSNAIKFTEKGKIVLSVAPSGQQNVNFTVTDTGIGIPADKKDLVFEAFRQADGTISRRYGGTGLGLSISRQLARLLGGTLSLESEFGVGSSFTISIPMVYIAAMPNKQAPIINASIDSAEDWRLFETNGKAKVVKPELPPMGALEDDRNQLVAKKHTILIVEDDQPFARIIYNLARELNFQCILAGNAEEALALIHYYVPSAVVLDVGLPDYSGLSVLDRLKRDPLTRHIPVHVVSASDYARTAFSLGAMGYMVKPVKREELAEALQKLETKLSQQMRKVLIVEDDPTQQEALRLLLTSEHVEAVGVSTAAECVDRLRNDTFDCMVLDLSLPDASGYRLLESLSREDTNQLPPVIIYTGRDLSAAEQERLRPYSRSIIIKGAKSPERLVDEVALFLHQVVAELPADRQQMLAQARSRDALLEGKRVLVVEDDVANVYALTSILEPCGVLVQIARNGREALEALERSSAQSPIDLVLMDVMMPEVDGLTATKEIRKRSEWKKLPIIMLTAKAMRDDQERCLEAGANDYMSKPLDVDKLLSLVRVWMPR